MTLAGRPPVNLGVTSSGNFYGNTRADVRRRARRQADELLRPVGRRSTARPRSPTRTSSGGCSTRCRASRRTTFYYGQNAGALYDPSLAPYIDRNLAQAGQSQRGGTAFVIYPFNRYRRVELFGGLHPPLRALHRTDSLQALADAVPDGSVRAAALPQRQHAAARRLVRPGDHDLPRVRARSSGSTMRLAYNASPHFGRFAGCRGRRSTATCATTSAWRPTACSPLRLRGLKSVGGESRTSCTSAATRRCAGTSTSSSSARRLLRQRRAALPDRSRPC